jgi:hypothetical protein
MDLEWFVTRFKDDPNLGRAIALYAIAPKNLAPAFQAKHFLRCGVAGSRETQNIDRSVTPSGAESRASSLYSRAAMYFANWIAGGTILAALVLPPSVVNAPSGPTITRVLERRNPGDARPDYALRGKTMAVALESLYHQELDTMPKVRRARGERVEWFQTTQQGFDNVKLALQAVGQGVYYDLTKHGNVLPEALVGKGVKLRGGQTLETTTHAFRKSPRLLELTRDEVEEEDGTVRLTLDDVEDIRNNTSRGQQLLELITRRPPKRTAEVQTDGPNVTTRSRRTQTVTVRLTRAKVRELRDAAATDDGEVRRRRLTRALAELA